MIDMHKKVKFYIINIILLLFIINHDLSAQVIAAFRANVTSGCNPLTVDFEDLSSGGPTSYFWDFGNGQTSILDRPSVTYISPGTYTVSLTVSNVFGTSTLTKSQFITVFNNPIADFSANHLTACSSQLIQFSDLSTKGNAGIKNWHWDFGDGNFLTIKNPLYSYSNAGKYSITLVVTDSNNCMNSIKKDYYIEIHSVKANFSSNQTSFCQAPASVSFNDLSIPKSSNYNYSWDFGDGNSSNFNNPVNIYTNTGIYTVKLIVVDQYGCKDEFVRTNYIDIVKVVSDFEIDIIDSCQPAYIEFYDRSTPNPGLSYSWDFGDNQHSTAKDPAHVFNNAKQYNIKLIASKGACSDIKTKTITVYPLPTATIIADTTRYCKIPFKVHFDALSSGQNTYLWDFGNGTTSTYQSDDIWYNDFGYYDVQLTVISKEGCVKSYANYNYVVGSPSGFSYTLNPTQGCKPLFVNFEIEDTSLIPLTYWTINSGNGQSLVNIMKGTFVYLDTGIYQVVISGSNSRGCNLGLVDTIKVGSPPNAGFADLSYIGCSDTFIKFTNTTNNFNPKANKFLWLFENNTNSSAENPSHKFQDTGFMDVTLIAYFNGCPDTFVREDIIYIYAPIAKIKDLSGICKSEVLSDLNISIGGNKWFWDFGDNTFDSIENPVHLFKPGVYIVILTITDTITGCTDYDTTVVHVTKRPATDFVADKLAGCPGLRVIFTDTSSQNLSYFWNFGNGLTSDSRSPSTTYLTGGLYTVSLLIKDANNCENRIVKKNYIKISGINPDFTVSKLSGCLPLDIDMNDISQSIFSIKNRQWDMGNGTVFNSDDKDTNYIYTKIEPHKIQRNGYEIKLELTDSIGCKQEAIKTVIPSKPKAYIFNSEIDQCQQIEVNYWTLVNDTTIYDFLRLAWYMNNIYAGNQSQIKQFYTGDTIVNVKLILEDRLGCRDIAEKTVSFTNDPPTAKFDYYIHTSANYCPPVIVDFYNKSIEGKRKIVSYKWDFGNYTYSYNENPTNTYSGPGTYTVTLIIEDSEGCTDTFIMPDIIKVNGAMGTINAFPKKGCDSLECYFIPKTTKVVRYLWNFGDGSTSNDTFPTHKYNYPGSFLPVLLMVDSFGCLTSTSMDEPIVVYKSPDADFETDWPMTCLGQKTSFINNTKFTQKIIEWRWDFGDGNSSYVYEPSYEYSDIGSYDVSLVAIDSVGCKDSVYKPGIAIVYYDTTSPASPYLYHITHIDKPLLDEIVFSANDEYDFKNYTIFRTDEMNKIFSDRKVYKIFDTFLIDTLFSNVIPQCYYLQSIDYCINISDPSKLHCLIYLEVEALSTGNELNWTPYIGWNSVEKYQIYRKNYSRHESFSVLIEVNGSTLYFLDTNVNCGDIYFYRIKAIEENAFNQTSVSNIEDVIARKTMYVAATELIRVSVENENVLIEWGQVDLDFTLKYLIYKSPDNVNYEYLIGAKSTKTSFIDKDVNTGTQSYYYNVRVQHHQCKFLSEPSNIGRTILLDVNKTDVIDVMKLSWNNYLYWESGVNHYDIEYRNPWTNVYEELNELRFDSNIFFHTINTFKIKHCYKVRAVQNLDPGIISNSNIACEEIEPRVNIPNSFTPNADGLNDYFIAQSFGCVVVKMQIFDRWGEKLFETDKYDIGWDGTFENQICPLGAYYYQIYADIDDEVILFYGTVTLLN